MKFTKPKSFFKILIIIFFVRLTGNIYGQINKTNFRIDTLKANWTSGTNPAQIKGEIYLSFKIPAGFTANLLMKSNPTGNYISKGIFGDATSTSTQRIRTKIPDLLVRVDIYCFYLELQNGSSTLVTKEICSIPFTREANVSVNNRIVFQIGSYQSGTEIPFNTFRPFIIGKCESAPEICIDDDDTFATNTKTVAPYRATKEYNSIVKCGEVKIYQVTIDVDGDGSMISISDTIKYKGFTKQTPSKLLDEWAYATVENDKVKLVWKNGVSINSNYTLEYQFKLERKDGTTGTFTALPNAPELERKIGNTQKFSWEYIDPTSTPTTIQHYYRLRYEDFCFNLSPEINVNPIFLSQDKKTFELVWNNENNNKVVDYEVEFYDLPTVEVRKTQLVQPKKNIYKAETSNYYRVKAKQISGDGSYIYSNFIPNDENLTVINPNIFTPDGKGPAETETFKVTSVAAYTFEINIYDRYGLLVYFSDDYAKHRRDGWNGKLIYTDIDLPEGTYVFQVEVSNSNRRNFTKRGSVILIRD